MKLIVGLGNPGKEYENTRHNIGFNAIDYIANENNIELNKEKFRGIYGEGFIEREKVILLKPTRYMNLSGDSIREVVNFYKIDNEDIIVLYDDISLEVGRIRIREKGSAGGHNGIKSIIANLGSDIFPRIKIGVGQPKGDLVSYVLGKFSKEETTDLKEVISVVEKAVREMVKVDAKEAMNKYNGFKLNKER